MEPSGARPVRALVLEGDGKPALAAVRSLERAGCEVDVVAAGLQMSGLRRRVLFTPGLLRRELARPEAGGAPAVGATEEGESEA